LILRRSDQDANDPNYRPRLLLLGALPTWPYSAGWGYDPSGGLGLVLLIVLVLVLAGYI
jgi:Protein of unknown function (DUF3309)